MEEQVKADIKEEELLVERSVDNKQEVKVDIKEEPSFVAVDYRMSKKILGFLKLLTIPAIIIYLIIFGRALKYIEKYVHIDALNLALMLAVLIFIALLPYLKAYIVYRWNILSVGDASVTITTGIISKTSKTISFLMMDEIVVNVNLWQRIFKIGNIRFIPSGEIGVEFKNIDNPNEIKQDIISKRTMRGLR